MFKFGFSSQSEGIEVWPVEGLEEVVALLDRVDVVEFSDGVCDGALSPSSPSFHFVVLPGAPEAKACWRRGCLGGSRDCHRTLARRRFRLR